MIKKNGHTLPVTASFQKLIGRHSRQWDTGASPAPLANLPQQATTSQAH